MATRSSILAWETPWTEEPGGLRSMGSESSYDQLLNDSNKSVTSGYGHTDQCFLCDARALGHEEIFHSELRRRPASGPSAHGRACVQVAASPWN